MINQLITIEPPFGRIYLFFSKHITRWALSNYKWSYGAPVNGRKSICLNGWGEITAISGVMGPYLELVFGPTL